MSPTRTSAIHVGLCALLLIAGAWLWSRHARAWDLGGGASVLAYDAAEYAVAARELAEHGSLSTPFALPIELEHHAAPPWPLALVQPGLVVAEAALFRIAGLGHLDAARIEWLVIALPLACYLAIGVIAASAAVRILARHAPQLGSRSLLAAGAVVGLVFLLDPEAQHYATGGFTELPFTLGLFVALALLALGHTGHRPFLFGLLLGATGWFRGNMLWLAPALALAAALAEPRGRRARIVALALAGYALPLAPWWLYKWRAFGSPGWDLAWVSIWDGIAGRTWFTLNHLPALPQFPHGMEAVRLIVAKTIRNIPGLLFGLALGPRGVVIAALALWPFIARPARPLAVAAFATFALAMVGVVTAAASVPVARYVFPGRVIAECAGLLALWGIVDRAPAAWLSAVGRRAVCGALAVLALGWGALGSAHGMSEARALSRDRGVPSAATLVSLSRRLSSELLPGEPVMSNLGPILAWYARRPVVHLALAPADVEACRERLEIRHVLLVFRDAERAWPQWAALLEHPADAVRDPELNIARARRVETADGFLVVWLEMGPPHVKVASSREARDRRSMPRPDHIAPDRAGGAADESRGLNEPARSFAIAGRRPL